MAVYIQLEQNKTKQKKTKQKKTNKQTNKNLTIPVLILYRTLAMFADNIEDVSALPNSQRKALAMFADNY